jgi:xylitol oxidase
VVGSRHSFNHIADCEDMMHLALPANLTVDAGRRTVSFAAGLTYGALAEALHADGLALRNMASLPHISVAGAVATATHGSGDRNGNLATAVAGLELVTSSGELLRSNRGDPEFEGMVVGLGALGVVTRLTLDVEPAYEVRQVVYENLTWRMLFEHFDEIFASGYSVSVFTRWREPVDSVWVKSRGAELPDELFGATPAEVDRHPIAELDAINCTPQLGRRGVWSDRLPHFRMNFTPSSGQELQSEYFVPRAKAIVAVEAVHALAERITPVLQISELRTVAGDRLWMSPEYGRDSLAIHFTWRFDQAGR